MFNYTFTTSHTVQKGNVIHRQAERVVTVQDEGGYDHLKIVETTVGNTTVTAIYDVLGHGEREWISEAQCSLEHLIEIGCKYGLFVIDEDEDVVFCMDYELKSFTLEDICEQAHGSVNLVK